MVVSSLERSTIEIFRDKLGRFYREEKAENENSLDVQKKYREIVQINEKLFKKIPYQVVLVNYEPYRSAKEMRERVCKEGIMYISTNGDPNIFMSRQENYISRAVHDCFAHLVCGCPFTFQGEYNAYLEQRKHYPEHLWSTLFAEIPMQTAAFYFGHNFDYKQRAFEAPQHLVDKAEKILKRDYSYNSVISFL